MNKELSNTSQRSPRLSNSWARKTGLAVKAGLIAATLMTMFPASAGLGWYRGEIKRIYAFPNGFVLTFKTNALDNCKHNYVYFRNDFITQKAVDQALAISLSAQAQGKSIGVVFDLDINGVGGFCNANGSIDFND